MCSHLIFNSATKKSEMAPILSIVWVNETHLRYVISWRLSVYCGHVTLTTVPSMKQNNRIWRQSHHIWPVVIFQISANPFYVVLGIHVLRLGCLGTLSHQVFHNELHLRVLVHPDQRRWHVCHLQHGVSQEQHGSRLHPLVPLLLRDLVHLRCFVAFHRHYHGRLRAYKKVLWNRYRIFIILGARVDTFHKLKFHNILLYVMQVFQCPKLIGSIKPSITTHIQQSSQKKSSHLICGNFTLLLWHSSMVTSGKDMPESILIKALKLMLYTVKMYCFQNKVLFVTFLSG